MKIYYAKAAVKAINSMDKPTKQRIREGILGLLETPPKGDIKNLAYELIKRMVLAWDADFSKVTLTEKKRIVEQKKQMEQGEFIQDHEIEWS